MTSPDRLDPLAFAGGFAELESDLPPGMTLPAWRTERRRPAAADLAPPGSHPVGGADVGASAAQRARPQPQEGQVNGQAISELLRGAATARERRAALLRLGREGRLAAYRRGEFNLDSCCLWAARYPREVPLLNGEFEFIARTTPEVLD
jgi:hypothetical protein